MKNRIRLLTAVVLLGLTSAVQAQDPPPPAPRPPMSPDIIYHRLRLATSADGLAWETAPEIVRESTTSPEVVVWQDQVWVYAIAASAESDAGQQLVGMRQGADGTWEDIDVELASFDGQIADPSVVVLDDGRLRMYFTDSTELNPSEPGAQTIGGVYSAVSEDGITFTLEEGTRFENAPFALYPDVVRTADGWLMFISRGDGTLVIAQSGDALTFESAGEIGGMNSDTTALADGSLQQLICGAGGMIAIKASPDGAQWIDFGSTGISGCDPSAVRNADGSWLMLYREVAPQGINAPPPLMDVTVMPPILPPQGGEPPPGAPPRP